MSRNRIIEIVTPNQAEELIILAEEEKEAVILKGPPASGKTAVANSAGRKIAESKGLEPVDTRIHRPGPRQMGIGHFNSSGFDPEDFAMPHFASLQGFEAYERRVSTALPGADESWTTQVGVEWQDIVCMVIAEEMGKKIENMKIWAELFNERSLGTNYLVPPQTMFVGTSNNADDDAGAHDIQADLISRATILQVRNSVDEFLKFHQGELHPLIITVVKYMGDNFLFTQSDEEIGKPFAGPRTVKKVSNFLNKGLDLDRKISQPFILGMIGEKATVELFATWRAWKSLGDIDAMINNPTLHKDRIEKLRNDTTHNGRQTICSMIAMLGKRVKNDASEVNKLIPFIKMFDDEAAVTFANVAMTVNEDVKSEPEFVNHYVENQADFYF